ncbi:hypothetical protein [Mycobacterium sp. DBP42]|uniref:hypothetical protein n=1 Tax=Mycobacterium sp. DBP42 TaxID=2545267 RepID=UPI00110CE488|nr:hypothetical protein [Mycobacterium sp. DBP42]TMS50861.1 hypothetical protein E0T84_21815 [Mycobacterium sp. DBP42]
MMQPLSPAESSSADQTEQRESGTARPSRLILRRKLLLRSLPILVLLLLLAVKLASVGVLGNKLTGEFATRDDAAMQNTLEWIDASSMGSGFREKFAHGDLLMLRDDVAGALEQFRLAHEMEPSACPPRGNFALIAEELSDDELKQGHFTKAREMLTPAVEAAKEDPGCFTKFPSRSADIGTFVRETPQRLAIKLAALKGGALTKTPDGYDYIRGPGGGIDFTESETGPCPYADDEDRMKQCIDMRDREIAQQAEAARLAKEQQEDAAEQPPRPATAQPEAPEPAPGSAPTESPGPAEGPLRVEGPSSEQVRPEYPDDTEIRPPGEPGFCDSGGTPLSRLAAVMCDTAGPQP